jgi:multidrug efflux pump subunit AcrA (membrane-fusion protein)
MKNIFKTTFPSIFLITGILILLNSCNSGTPASSEEEKIITPVTLTEISTGPISENIELPALSTYLNRNIVRSTATGMIEKVLVTFGDNVKTDQALFTLKTREAAIIAGSIKGDSSLAFRGDIKINASKDGVITSVSHQGGDFVQEGDELAIISDRESFVFILEVPFELSSLIESNKKCSILFPDGKTIAGNITGQLPEMDPSAQTVKYFIKAPVSGALLSNLNVKVKIVKRENQKATILAREAVLGNETQTEFWIMKLINDSVAIKVPVKKGIENNTSIEIAGPAFLHSDRIVLTGGYGLPDTANIIVKR